MTEPKDLVGGLVSVCEVFSGRRGRVTFDETIAAWTRYRAFAPINIRLSNYQEA